MKPALAAAWTRALELVNRGVSFLRGSPVVRARAHFVVAACIVACGRTSPSANAPDTSTPVSSSRLALGADAGEAGAPEGPSELWGRAQGPDATEEDLMRLASTEGPVGLGEHATDKATRLLAARAMAHTRGLAGLPWLADACASEDAELAKEAALSATALAAHGRDQNDPEDADEMREGCTKLLAVAKDGKPSREVRVGAVRTLRLLSDRGCVKADEIPKDFALAP